MGRARRTSRLPRRRVDRIADAVVWSLCLLAVATLVGAAALGVAVHREVVERARAQAAERTEVAAVTTEVVHAALGSTAGRAVGAVRWTTPDGVTHEGHADIAAPADVGVRVPVWLDRSGALVPAPARAQDATPAAVAVALFTVLVGTCALLLLYLGADRLLMRCATRGWEREWARVGPQWTGRAGLP